MSQIHHSRNIMSRDMRKGEHKETHMKLVTLVMMVALTGGCGVHSVWNVSDRMSAKSAISLPAHSNPVFVSKAGLRPGSYDFVGQIDLSRNTCEGDRDVMGVLADKARDLGCDAVVEVDIWRKPSGWCNQSPHANGQCVKLRDPTLINGMDGLWL